MPQRKPSAHSQLDALRQQAADARVLHRELQAEMGAAKLKVEQAGTAIADAYAGEDQRAVTTSRKAEETAVAKVEDLQHRLTGAEIRVERAQAEADTFARERARDLLAEREQPARTVAAELTATVHETLRLAKAYVAERQTQDVLVAAVPGATPRSDGPPPEHEWEAALGALERTVRETPEIPAPLPRWAGVEHRRQQDNLSRFEKLRRRKRLTQPEQDELDRINRELGRSAPRAEVV
jgi:hypothetical protein